MKDHLTRNTLTQIQEIVTRATGVPLTRGARSELSAVLEEAFGRLHTGSTDSFISREVTILLADLRGFTSLSATYPAGTVIEMLNSCLARMSEVIFRNQGTIDKFMGDSIMVLFGAPTSHSDDVQRALRCAVEMQLAMQDLNRERAPEVPELFMGIGLNTGNVLAGTIGSRAYSEYTVIGDEVNLASRIEAFTLRGQVLISASTYARSQGYITAGDPMDVHVKGKNKAVALRELLAIPSLGLEVPRQEVRRSHRVEVDLPLTFQIVQDKIVLPEVCRGRVRDIGYHGVLVELERDVPVYTELELEFDIPLVGYHAANLYAKVVNMKERDGRKLAGLEFTSVSAEINMNIQLFTQLLIVKR